MFKTFVLRLRHVKRRHQTTAIKSVHKAMDNAVRGLNGVIISKMILRYVQVETNDQIETVTSEDRPIKINGNAIHTADLIKKSAKGGGCIIV